VALLDLDRFKQINDTHGHLIGDEVLRHVADAMSGLLREYDLAGRFGGEEFVMLLPQTRAPDAFKIADRVRAHIARQPIPTTGGEPVPVSVSIGVAALDAGSSRELTELLAAADAALYRAKASGRNQVQMISTSRGLSAVRSPVDDEPVGAVGGAFRGPGADAPETGRDDGKLGFDAEFGDDEFDQEFADDEFQVPDEGTASTATTSAFAV
jgi:diguanylate cyclase (GGDEF)-like protein